MVETTSIPNIFFDQYFKVLSAAELKVLLVIARWPQVVLKHQDFVEKTGLSVEEVKKALVTLKERGLIERSGLLSAKQG